MPGMSGLELQRHLLDSNNRLPVIFIDAFPCACLGCAESFAYFVPIVGNIAGIQPPTLYAVVQFQNASMPAVMVIGFAVLQIAISNFVYPASQGHSLSLSPFAIVVALAFGSWLWASPARCSPFP